MANPLNFLVPGGLPIDACISFAKISIASDKKFPYVHLTQMARRPKIPEWPEEERPRERLRTHGPEKLSDAELLAIVLRVGGKDDTAIDLARHLINQFGGFRGLDSRSVAELCQGNGIGPAKAAQIKAALEIAKRLFRESSQLKDKVNSSQDVLSSRAPIPAGSQSGGV